MAKDVFGSEIKGVEAWSLDGAIISINNGVDLLVSSVGIQYQRAINPIKPLNKAKKSLIVGEGSGSVTMNVIVGPKDGLADFLKNFSDPCKIAENSLTVKSADLSACAEGEGTVFNCSGMLLQSLGVNAQGGGDGLAMVNGSLQFHLGGLTLG